MKKILLVMMFFLLLGCAPQYPVHDATNSPNNDSKKTPIASVVIDPFATPTPTTKVGGIQTFPEFSFTVKEVVRKGNALSVHITITMTTTRPADVPAMNFDPAHLSINGMKRTYNSRVASLDYPNMQPTSLATGQSIDGWVSFAVPETESVGEVVFMPSIWTDGRVVRVVL